MGRGPRGGLSFGSLLPQRGCIVRDSEHDYDAVRDAMERFVLEIEDDSGIADPQLHCDLVMKGGITSGVIYPWAVAELARTYRFKHVGGSSAGAMAAAAAAAAEVGRPRGFVQLAKLPAGLGEEAGGMARMRRLFQSEPSTKPLFSVLAGWVKESGGGSVGAVAGLIGGFWRWIALAVFAGVVSAFATHTGARWVPSIIVGALTFAFVLAVALVARVLYMFKHQLPRNFYGLCRGSRGSSLDREEQVTDWLARVLDDMAGLAHEAEPLTWGHLWRLRGPAKGERTHGGHGFPENWVDLHIMTTNITQGRPQELPNLGKDCFFFDPDELAKLFPPDVVAWMELKGGEREGVEYARQAAERGLVPMPAPEDLPVVVAARMSFGFPLVLSAVPLWCVDLTADQSERPIQDDTPDADGLVRFERNWFSDGGDCSNMPVHMFDTPIPKWPTFGLNLRETDRNLGERQADWVFLPTADTPASGAYSPWVRPKDRSRPGTFGWFTMAIFQTIQNWNDNLAMTQPGCRDRIAHIYHAANEGGMNLDMRLPKMYRLAERGRQAAKKLVGRYAPPIPGTPAAGWTDQRWLRYRTAMAGQEEWLEKFDLAYEDGMEPATVSYARLADSATCFPIAHKHSAEECCRGLTQLAHDWGARGGHDRGRTFRGGEPTPALRLHLRRALEEREPEVAPKSATK